MKVITNTLKKIISVLFLLTYLNVAFGSSIDCHYCCGKLVNIKIYGVSLAKHNCSHSSMSSDCCKDKIHYCKTDNHTSPAVVAITTPETSIKAPVFVIDSFDFLSLAASNEINNILYLRQSRTDKAHACSLFISNRVLRI
jgi:hypothetical protein